MSTQYLGGGRKVDLGPSTPYRPHNSMVGARFVSDPLALGVTRLATADLSKLRGIGMSREFTIGPRRP